MTLVAPYRRTAQLAALTVAFACGGCSTVGNTFSNLAPKDVTYQTTHGIAAAPAVNPTDKLRELPLGPDDVDCPGVEVAQGGAAYRVGGEANAQVRYQFDLGDLARECRPNANHQFEYKIGMAGGVIVGPAGSPGKYSASLKVTITRTGVDKPVFVKTYRVEADTAGALQGAFHVVTEPIVLPLTRRELSDDYTVTVGFEGGRNSDARPAHGRRRPRPG